MGHPHGLCNTAVAGVHHLVASAAGPDCGLAADRRSGHGEHACWSGDGQKTQRQIKDVLRLKERLNRPKDQLDIKNIRQYIMGKNL